MLKEDWLDIEKMVSVDQTKKSIFCFKFVNTLNYRQIARVKKTR